jgi:hypothetical protein
VAGEIHIKSVALAQELQLALMEMRAGFTKAPAQPGLAQRRGRCGYAGGHADPAERFGTSMGDSLRMHSDNLRGKRSVIAEEAAAKIALLLFPLIFCIFPTLMLVLIGPPASDLSHDAAHSIGGHDEQATGRRVPDAGGMRQRAGRSAGGRHHHAAGTSLPARSTLILKDGSSWRQRWQSPVNASGLRPCICKRPLRAHDVQQDYATLKQALNDGVPRTQVRQLAPGLVEVTRTQAHNDIGVVRLEISNGNGVTGAAARLARSLDGDGVKTVRLSNVRPFVVPQSRIEYQREQQKMAQALGRRLNLPLQPARGASAYADLRIVLGHDVRYLK